MTRPIVKKSCENCKGSHSRYVCPNLVPTSATAITYYKTAWPCQYYVADYGKIAEELGTWSFDIQGEKQ